MRAEPIAEEALTKDTETFPRELYWRWLEIMLRIRLFEDASYQAYLQGKIRGFLHLYNGEEAVAAGTVTAVREDDPIISAYRDHGIALARGMSTRAAMAELFGKVTGCSKGKGGSMHFFDREHNMFGGFAIVGSQIAIGAGIAFAEKYRKSDRVCITFFGDGAINQGILLETLNMAKLWSLPVVFICENNQYAMGTAVWRSSALHHAGGLYRIAEPFGIPTEAIYGMDVEEVHRAVSRAAAHARSGYGPYFLEMRTYRYRGHSMSDPGKYRPREELDDFRARDPIERLRQRMLRLGYATPEELDNLEKKIEAEIDDALEFAESSPYPPPEELWRDVYVQENYPFWKEE